MSAEAYRWKCACCGKQMTGLPMNMSFGPPVDWDRVDSGELKVLQLDEDFCKIQNPDGQIDHFIRCLMPLPVPQLHDEFGFGVWMSVSAQSCDVYEAGFDSGHYAKPGCFGYLMHQIAEYPGSFLLHADVEFWPGNERPRVFLHDADHPLVNAQENGVDAAQVQRWVALTHRS